MVLVPLPELNSALFKKNGPGKRKPLSQHTSVGNSSHQIDAILLDLLVTILENGCEPGQQVLDGRRHLGHPDDVDDGLQGAQDRAQHLGILFAQVLVQDNLHKITSSLLTKIFPFLDKTEYAGSQRKNKYIQKDMHNNR